MDRRGWRRSFDVECFVAPTREASGTAQEGRDPQGASHQGSHRQARRAKACDQASPQRYRAQARSGQADDNELIAKLRNSKGLGIRPGPLVYGNAAKGVSWRTA